MKRTELPACSNIAVFNHTTSRLHEYDKNKLTVLLHDTK